MPSRDKIIRVMKKELCFISTDFETDVKKEKQFNKTYKLPDGKFLSVGNESFISPEILFKAPALFQTFEV